MKEGRLRLNARKTGLLAPATYGTAQKGAQIENVPWGHLLDVGEPHCPWQAAAMGSSTSAQILHSPKPSKAFVVLQRLQPTEEGKTISLHTSTQ